VDRITLFMIMATTMKPTYRPWVRRQRRRRNLTIGAGWW